jgi:hypothetical protein
MFHLRIAHLEAIYDFHPGGIDSAFKRGHTQETGGHAQNQRRVLLLQLPAAGYTWRYDVDVPVYSQPAVILPASAASDVNRRYYMNRDGGSLGCGRN